VLLVMETREIHTGAKSKARWRGGQAQPRPILPSLVPPALSP
jgi:hypothetical protein